MTDLKEGDKVCVQPTIHDGDCRACKRGLTNSCDKFGFIGLSGWGGGMLDRTDDPIHLSTDLLTFHGTIGT